MGGNILIIDSSINPLEAELSSPTFCRIFYGYEVDMDGSYLLDKKGNRIKIMESDDDFKKRISL